MIFRKDYLFILKVEKFIVEERQNCSCFSYCLGRYFVNYSQKDWLMEHFKVAFAHCLTIEF